MHEPSNWSLETHNMAVKALTKIESHEAECARRYSDLTLASSIVQKSIEGLQNKVGSIELKIAGIVGGIVVLREAIAEGVKLLTR